MSPASDRRRVGRKLRILPLVRRGVCGVARWIRAAPQDDSEDAGDPEKTSVHSFFLSAVNGWATTYSMQLVREPPEMELH